MNELTEEMDRLLFEINNKRWVSLSKDSPKQVFKAKDKLRAYNLIERQGKYSWRLTQSGYDAVELGGFKAWKNKLDSPTPINKSNNTNEPLIKRIVIGVIIIILGGVGKIYFLPLFQYNNDDPIEKNLYDQPDRPIGLVFKDGQKATLTYSISLSLIDSVLLNTVDRFGNSENAIEYILEKANGEIISTMESLDIRTARVNRDSIESVILSRTLDDQYYSGYKISALNLKEIR